MPSVWTIQASATWDKFRKERDFHRMHHKRVSQEKNKLIHDMQVLKRHYSMVGCFSILYLRTTTA